jgi:predicted metalloprotease
MGSKLVIGGGPGGIVILILSLLLGGNNPLDSINAGTAGSYPPSEEEDERAQFRGVVLKDTEDVWNALFEQEFNAGYENYSFGTFWLCG